MPLMTCSTACRLVTLLALAIGCGRGTAPARPEPLVTQRAPCLRAPMPPPSQAWIGTVYSAQATDVEAALWQRIEALELWAARAWASCGTAR